MSMMFKQIRPGAKKLLPKEGLHSFPGFVVDRLVPDVMCEPIFELNNRVFGRQEPVDWARGIQDAAEVKVLLHWWDVDQLEGNVVVCPTEGHDKELLHQLFEYAYRIESMVEGVRDFFGPYRTIAKHLWKAVNNA